MSDTIYAPATAAGRAAVAVVRLSGPAAGAAVRALAGSLPAPRRASLRLLRGEGAEPLDRALVLWMPGPASFTGEDAAELHLHGGPAVVEAVLQALGAQGLRLAEPGEFTRRAFEAGKLDLVEAEAVADLVDAQTQAQRRQALDQLGGALSRVHARWRETLLEVMAHLEAAVDFPDEDLPEAVAERSAELLRDLREELSRAVADTRGARVREGLHIAIIGAPNAGKSSLLNALAGRDMAIVAPSPGTTRDVVEARIELAGLPAVLADTAGLRTVEDAVEHEGVARARRWAASADLRLWVVDGASEALTVDQVSDLLRHDDVLVLNKSDLAAGRATMLARAHHQGLAVCVAAGNADVAQVAQVLETWATGLQNGAEPVAATRERHRACLNAALERVDGALAIGVGRPELMAEEVRLAARELERLTGRIDPEAVLGRIFASFCIGK